MRTFGIVVVVVVLLLIGGGLTAQLASQGQDSAIPFLIRQTDDPEGSRMDMLPWMAEQFVLMAGFIIFNLVGIGVTIALIMWFLDRQVRISRREGRTASAAGTAVAAPPTETSPTNQ